ncbi:subtilisin-like protein [Anaeromyces robustus]|uniref:Subtilisin-like protein n=1 Tax=Anaeromyces robustus TaxID=1754192 RepID=A0A1Y1XBV5_9FUNG|nr:subtilisin-like protein [Anaeromyces robustus]|eukprot:ORX83217.1 subtilisin-like protein [Anaeromyces robustus]
MRKLINVFLLSIIITLFTNNIHAMNINVNKNNKIETESLKNDVQKLKEIENDPNADNFYLIFVNYTLVDNDNENNTEKIHNKRHEENREEFINSLMDEIHDLITDNIDTYKHPEDVEEILDKEKLRKRDDQFYFGIVNNISSLKDITVLTAILSENLVDNVKNMNGVYDCIPNRAFDLHNSYHEQEILEETKWSKLAMKNNTDVHLSLISQGIYNPKLISKYDNTFYYPEQAGKNSKIVIIDSAFNFNHEEFSNTDRTVSCVIGVDHRGEILTLYDSKECIVGYSDSIDHGTVTADLAGGLQHGVAPNADIYGFPVALELNFITVITVLQFIAKYLLVMNDNNKIVFNFSFGSIYKKNEFSSYFEYLQYLIDNYNNHGVIFVASAGNYNRSVYNVTSEERIYPCYLDKVICVGATDNPYNTTSNNSEQLLVNSYRKADFSDYGDGVDIYAPGYHNYAINSIEKKKNTEGIFNGTSGSAPIVAGVVATIMSEYPKTTFNYDSMLNYLKKISFKNAIVDIEKDHPSNYFINNGKHVVYSEDDIYYGCGINAGYNKCGDKSCCSSDGYCVKDENSCKIENGCQSNYGICNL